MTDNKQRRLQHLNPTQVREVYDKRMKADFPASELKPLEMIEQSVQKGIYECLGMFETDEIIGYAFLIRMGTICLIDYLAVVPEQRDKGMGGELLRLLGKHLKEDEAVIGEVEIPSEAEDEAERTTRTRRLRFYLRNGLIDTGVSTVTFGVPFEILRFDNGKELSKRRVSELYEKIYRFILPPDWYDGNIVISDCSSIGERG